MAGDRVNQQDDYSPYQRGDDDRYYKKKSKHYNNGEKRRSSRRRYREMQDQSYSDSHNGSARRSKTKDHDDTTNSVISTDGGGGNGSSDTTSIKQSSRGKHSTSDRHEQSSDPLDHTTSKDQEPYRIDKYASDQSHTEQDVEIPDHYFTPPRSNKDTTLPEKFLSSPTMEQLGLDEQDTRKFMHAIKAYNKLMAKEQMKHVNDQKQVDDKNDQQEKEPSNDDNQPPSKTQNEDGSHKLLENNVKYDKKPSKPTLQDLVGKTVDKDGNILDDDGKVFGKVSRDMSYLDGKKVNENGDIVDHSGNIYGKAEPVDPPSTTNTNNNRSGSSLAVRNGDEDVIVNVDAHKGGISFAIHIPRAK